MAGRLDDFVWPGQQSKEKNSQSLFLQKAVLVLTQGILFRVLRFQESRLAWHNITLHN